MTDPVKTVYPKGAEPKLNMVPADLQIAVGATKRSSVDEVLLMLAPEGAGDDLRAPRAYVPLKDWEQVINVIGSILHCAGVAWGAPPEGSVINGVTVMTNTIDSKAPSH